jgi:tetratricopeptide (TPR) repeat protein
MRIRFMFCLLAVFLVFMALDSNAQTGAAKGKGRASGNVTGPDGKGLEGATVQFTSDKLKTSFELKTDNKGHFGVAGIAGGPWNIDFVKEGYATKRISVQVSELGYNKPINVQLEAATAKAAAAQTPGMKLLLEGDTLLQSKDYAGAIAKYEAAIQANPALFKAYGNIGNLYMESNQPDKAIEAYKLFLAKEPANQDIKLNIATAYLKQGNIEEAKKALADLQPAQLTNVSALYNVGVGFYNAKETAEAIKYWEMVVARDPSNSDAHLQLGFAYYGQNQPDKAKQELQKVIDLDPNSENAKSAKEMLDTMK